MEGLLIGIAASLVAGVVLAGGGWLWYRRNPRRAGVTKEDLERVKQQIFEYFNHWRAVPQKSTEQLVSAAPPDRFKLLEEAAEAQREHRYAEAVEHLRAALTPDLPAAERASLLVLIGNSLLNLSRLDGAEDTYKEALAAAAEAGDEQARAAALGNLGIVYAGRGDLDRAEEHHKQALEIDRRIDDPLGQATALGNLGIVYHQRGHLDRAEEHYKDALEIHRRIDNPLGQAVALGNLGLVHADRGDLERAEEHHRQALEDRKSVV